MFKKSSLLTRLILVSVWVDVPLFCLTAADSMSILAWGSSKLTALLNVVVAPLVPPVRVSLAVKWLKDHIVKDGYLGL